MSTLYEWEGLLDMLKTVAIAARTVLRKINLAVVKMS